jgi:hypothetical protein
MKWLWDRLGSMPSTNAVIFNGMLIATFTAIRYLLSGVHFDLKVGTFGFAEWTPSGEWLLFVAAVLGVGTTQFGIKRSTSAEYQATKQPQVNARTAEVTAEQVTVKETGAEG